MGMQQRRRIETTGVMTIHIPDLAAAIAGARLPVSDNGGKFPGYVTVCGSGSV